MPTKDKSKPFFTLSLEEDILFFEVFIREEELSSFIPSVLSLSILSILVFNCGGFSVFGFSAYGFSADGFSDCGV
jgi:hypothetical protein